jgi:hypothetical protein
MANLPLRTRKDFFEVLNETARDAERLASQAPDFEPYQQIVEQLRAMQQWTAGGRTPTATERDSTSLGLIAIRELDPQPEGFMASFIPRLHELDGYFREWPADP